jgi:hypothetical protein
LTAVKSAQNILNFAVAGMETFRGHNLEPDGLATIPASATSFPLITICARVEFATLNLIALDAFARPSIKN